MAIRPVTRKSRINRAEILPQTKANSQHRVGFFTSMMAMCSKCTGSEAALETRQQDLQVAK